MYIINRRKNIRLIGDEHHIGDDIYKVQIKVGFGLQLKNLMKMNIMMLLIVLDIVLILI
nr:MAG: hypothetical protein [Bacteriophage sp.]